MNNFQPTLTILTGVPASGKSTFVSQYKESHPDTVICSTDNYIEEYATEQNKTYSEVFAEYIPIAVSKMMDDIHYAKRNNLDVIFDQTNLTVKSRKKKLKLFPNYIKVAVVFPIPDENELYRRLKNRPGKNIPENVMQSMIRNYSMPSKEEGFEFIDVV